MAVWRPAPDRPDPIGLLEEQAATRLPELVPLRYGRMAVSPFDFYRGAALPMAADLAATPHTGIVTPALRRCPPLELRAVRIARADLVFDINDFDETLRGPFEWDLKRLAASLVVAAAIAGFSAHDGRHAVHRAIRSYRTRMAEYAAMRAIDVYYAHVDAASILGVADKQRAPVPASNGPFGSPSRRDARAAEADRGGRGRSAADR